MTTLSVTFTLSEHTSGATPSYPELAPFYVLAQLSQHVTSYYHSKFVPVRDGQRVTLTLTAPQDRRQPLSPSAHVALTFVATTHAPDDDARAYLVPLGELCLSLESTTFERLAFVDPCSRRHGSRQHDSVIKAYALDGVVELLHGSGSVRSTLLEARREQELLMTSYRRAFTRFVQVDHRPALDYLRWMHMPEYVTREDRRVPAWALLLRRPSKALEDEAHARPSFFQNLLECALRIVNVVTSSPLTQRHFVDAIDRLLAPKQPFAADLTKQPSEALRLCALVGTVVGLALSLYATHSVYGVDHTNHAVHGGGGGRRAVRGQRLRDNTIEVVERIFDIQEFKGADCEKKAAHIYMLTQLLRESSEAWAQDFPLVARVARYLRVVYAPALLQVTAVSERASVKAGGGGGDDAKEHTMAALLPWWLLRDVGVAVRHGLDPALLSSDQRQVLAHAPPLWLEGTALTWPLLAPLEAYMRFPTSAMENDGMRRQTLDARTQWLSSEIRALSTLDTLIDATEHAGTRTEYLTSQRRLSSFYGHVTHLWLEEAAAAAAASGVMPWDYLVTERERDVYGVKAPHLILGDTRAFTLLAMPRGGGAAMPAAHARAQDALSIYVHDSLLGETAIAPLSAPAAQTPPASAAWAPLQAAATAKRMMPEQWRACFFVPVRSMELDAPPFSVRSLLDELSSRRLCLQVERLRLTDTCEWVMLVISAE